VQRDKEIRLATSRVCITVRGRGMVERKTVETVGVGVNEKGLVQNCKTTLY
jgi:hypothetical protein